jgi:hypothetical protein
LGAHGHYEEDPGFLGYKMLAPWSL